MLNKTPMIGDKLVYRNARDRSILPVEVVKVSAAVCEVRILAGGLDDSLKGHIIRAHVALLFTR